MAACTPETRHAFLTDLGTANQTARTGISAKRAADKDRHWAQWEIFIATLPGVDPYLNSVDPRHQLSFLKVFATRVRRGTLTPSHQPVHAKRVSDYVRTVAKEIRLGSHRRLDPRLDAHNLQEEDLVNLTKAYHKQDPPPDKVKPIPITLVHHACVALCATALATPVTRTVANLLVIGFFYLLRPGEYTYDARNNHPFRLQDVTFDTPHGLLNAAIAPTAQLRTAFRVLLNFTDQKNGERDQAVTQGDTPDPILSPLKAVIRQVLHLRQNNAPPETPLYTAFHNGCAHRISAKHLTTALRSSCKTLGPTLGISSRDISVRALRSGGCMALLRAGIDPLHARLMGRWKSWAMIEYLHNSGLDTTSYAGKMLVSGAFTIPQHQKLPADILPLVQPYLED